MNDAILAFLGVLLGAGIALLGTVLTNRCNSKLEINKMKLSYLIEKRAFIESFLNNEYSFSLNGDMGNIHNIEKEYTRLEKFLLAQEAYRILTPADWDEFHSKLSELNIMLELTKSNLIANKIDFIHEVHWTLRKELESTVRKMDKIIN